MSTMEIITITPQHTAVVRDAVPMDALTELFGRAFTAVYPAVAGQGIEITGPPFGFYPEARRGCDGRGRGPGGRPHRGCR